MRTPRHILRRPLPLSAFVRLSAFFPFKNAVDKNTALCYTHVMIRMLAPQDKALFLAMSEEFYASPAVEHSVPRQFHEDAFDEIMRQGPYLTGYALLQKTYSREAGGLTIWIDEIYLRPAFRGKGLAKELFALAHTLGAKRLRLEVEPENARAVMLYQKLGFRASEYRSMVKDLSAPSPSCTSS